MKKAILFLSIFLSSCVEHKELIDISLKVGNLYCSDGSVIDPESYQSSGKTAIGVIFWINNNSELTTDKAFAVSLENLPPVQWCDTLVKINNVTTSLGALDGASNTASLIAWGIDEGRNTPAVSTAYNYVKHGVSGWFLPSIAQASEISAKKNLIYSSLTFCNGEEFNDVWYWTSTEDGSGSDNPSLNALSISLTEGRATGSNKLNIFAVRPIIAIK